MIIDKDFIIYFRPQLIDVGAATQTPYAQKAMLDLVQFEQDYSTEYPERLLLAMAYSSHPGDYLLKDILVSLERSTEKAIKIVKKY